MTCPNSGASLHGAVKAFISTLDGLPGPAGLVGKGLNNRINGQKADATLQDFAESTAIMDVAAMAVGQAAVNAGRHIAGAIISQAASADEAASAINRNIDANPDGGAGTCDPEGNGGQPGSGREEGGGGGAAQPAIKDPLVLDLDGDGIELTSLAASQVYFDFDGDGFAERSGWVGSDDGLLVLDRNVNGQIDDGGELFGDAGTDGFDALRKLDSNGDAVFDYLDNEFSNVRVWQDTNANGVTDAGELKTLASASIFSISVDGDFEGYESEGNWVARSGTVQMVGGGAHVAKSVYFATDTHATSYVVPEGFQYDPLALALPQLKGYGTVKDLAVAISEDAHLFQLLRTFIVSSNGMSAAEFRTAVEGVVAAWVSVDEAPSTGRGTHVDYAKLAVVEAFQGQPFWETDIVLAHAKLIADRYDSIIDGLMARLAVQISLAYFTLGVVEDRDVGFLEHSLSAFSVFSYDIQTDTISGRPDLFLALATTRLSGSARDQLAKFETLVEVGKTVSSVIFGGDHKALSDRLAALAPR